MSFIPAKSNLKRGFDQIEESHDDSKRRKVIFKEKIETVIVIKPRKLVKALEMMSDLTFQKYRNFEKNHPQLDIEGILQKVYEKKISTPLTSYTAMIFADFRDFIKKEFLKMNPNTIQKSDFRQFTTQFTRDILRILETEWRKLNIELEILADICLQEL